MSHYDDSKAKAKAKEGKYIGHSMAQFDWVYATLRMVPCLAPLHHPLFNKDLGSFAI